DVAGITERGVGQHRSGRAGVLHYHLGYGAVRSTGCCDNGRSAAGDGVGNELGAVGPGSRTGDEEIARPDAAGVFLDAGDFDVVRIGNAGRRIKLLQQVEQEHRGLPSLVSRRWVTNEKASCLLIDLK